MSQTADRRRTLHGFSVAIGGVGGVLLIGSVPSPIGWVDWPTSFVAPAAVLIGVGFTTLIAQLGLETVLDKRRAALDSSTRQNRSRVYEEIFGHVIASFGGAQTLTEHAVRSRAATWASTETLSALTEWFRYATRHTGTVTDAPDELAERFELVYRVAKAMRIDLELDDPEVSKNVLVGTIFDNYDPMVHDSPRIRDLVVDPKGNAVIPAATASEVARKVPPAGVRAKGSPPSTGGPSNDSI